MTDISATLLFWMDVCLRRGLREKRKYIAICRDIIDGLFDDMPSYILLHRDRVLETLSSMDQGNPDVQEATRLFKEKVCKTISLD